MVFIVCAVNTVLVGAYESEANAAINGVKKLKPNVGVSTVLTCSRRMLNGEPELQIKLKVPQQHTTMCAADDDETRIGSGAIRTAMLQFLDTYLQCWAAGTSVQDSVDIAVSEFTKFLCDGSDFHVLKLYKNNTLLPQSSQCLYLATHVVYVLTRYGTQVSSHLNRSLLSQRITGVLRNWLRQLTENVIVLTMNLDEACEVATCLLQLDGSCYDDMVQRVLELVRSLGEAVAPSLPESPWLNSKSSSGSLTHRRSHVEMVVAQFLAETIRSVPAARVLADDGYVVVRGLPLPEQLKAFMAELQASVAPHNDKCADLLVCMAPNTPPTAVRMTPPSQRDVQAAYPSLYATLWSDLQGTIARVLGVDHNAVCMIPEETFLRRKSPNSTTAAHADVFHYCRTPVTANVFGRTAADIARGRVQGACAQCGDTVNVRVMLCVTCANGPLRMYTCWMPLHDIKVNTHSVLQLVPQSHLLQGFSVDLCRRKSELVQPAPMPTDFLFPAQTLAAGEMVLFNCKTAHRADSGERARWSLDIRFVLLKR
jgi:hypothetical protein